MLRYRICASCGSTIESPTAYFCYRCGQILNQNQDGNSLESNSFSPSPVIVTSSFSLKGRFFLAVLFLLFILCLSIIYYWLRFGPDLKASPPGRRPENAVLLQNFNFTVAPFNWEKVSLAELVPETADAYVFGRSPADFLTRVISEEQMANYKSAAGLTLAETQTYLEDDFAFFRQGESFGFLSKIKARPFVEQKIAEIKKSKLVNGYVPYLIGDYLLVTDSPELADLVTETIGKTRFNLSLKAAFTETWRDLPHQGQYLIFSSDHNQLGRVLIMIFGNEIGTKLTEKIKGSALVITSAAAGTLLRGIGNGK